MKSMQEEEHQEEVSPISLALPKISVVKRRDKDEGVCAPLTVLKDCKSLRKREVSQSSSSLKSWG